MAYDPDMGGDTGPLLAAMGGVFAGHVRRDVVVVETWGPGETPWCPRATIVFLLDPDAPGSRCGAVDLLHPSESGSPRCGAPECRCMANP
jgi:hypothetical protein